MTNPLKTTDELLIQEREARHNQESMKHLEIIKQLLSLNKNSESFLSFSSNLCRRHNAFPASINHILDTLTLTFESDPDQGISYIETVISITEGKLLFEIQYNKALTLLFNFYMKKYNVSKEASNLLQALGCVEKIKLDNFTDKNYQFQLSTILNNYKTLILISLSNIQNKVLVDNNTIHKLTLIHRKTKLLNIRKDITTENTLLDLNKCYFYYSSIHILNDNMLANNRIGNQNQSSHVEFDTFTNLNLNEVDFNKDLSVRRNDENIDGESEITDNGSFVQLAETILDLFERTNEQVLFFLAVCFSLSGRNNQQKDNFISQLKSKYRNSLANLNIASDKGSTENLDSLLSNLNDRDLVYFDNSNLKSLFSVSVNSRLKDSKTLESLTLGENNNESLSLILQKLFQLAQNELKNVVAEYNIYILRRSVKSISLDSFARVCCLKDASESEGVVKKMIRSGKLNASIDSITKYVHFERSEDKENKTRIDIVNKMIDDVEHVSSLIEKEYFKIKAGL